MALSAATMSATIKTEIKNRFSEFGFGDEDWLTRFCDALGTAIVTRIKADADIDLQANDISVNPGSFQDSLSAPITGQGVNAAVTLNQRIK